MQSITLLANKLSRDYPSFQFEASNEFRWHPQRKTVFFDQTSQESGSLLHELAHALLNHQLYNKDLHLLEIERDAWNYTLNTLAPKYHLSLGEEEIQDALDTYREWLHARSTCPNCKATGLQTKNTQYKCLVCGTLWKANDSRVCHLRRYVVTKKRP